MILKGIIDEDFINYKKPSMTLMFPHCTFKCGVETCQNSSLFNTPDIDIDISSLINRYLNNNISEAIVMQGMEPFDSWDDLSDFILKLRMKCSDDIVIYTGYDKEEISSKIKWLSDNTNNIIVKFGRYVPNQEKHFDKVLNVYLASDNQYAERIC